ncbi:MAG: histidinol dehydrogenase [Dehalococcoidia bacterium]|nr:histidinol dehydrogenase [Dehalococcoidia bacterium]
MRIVLGADEARRSLLRRRPLTQMDVPPHIHERTRAVFGRELSPAEAVARIIRDVRNEGDAALRRYSEAFDGVPYPSLTVSPEEVKAAYEQVEPRIAAALRFAAERIRLFHEMQYDRTMSSFTKDGLGMRVRALQRVGVYALGTDAVYPSSVLMTALPAKVACVEEMFMISPVDRAGRVSPLKLVAADIAGIDSVFCGSGAQAIAAFAFGTETVPRVDKICGPGNIFVTLAKQQLYGVVGIDSVYGPTETVIIADGSADPALCAADLLAQAEHDELATALLITTSRRFAADVEREVERQLTGLERERVARASMEARGGAVIVRTLDEAIALANEYAPEHLCLLVRNPRPWSRRVRNAGGVFIGESSPEAMGDYTAGPSHVMPTAGSARFSSPLNVLDFLKITNVVGVGEESLREWGPAAAAIARAEGLTAHARAIEMRLGLDGGSDG